MVWFDKILRSLFGTIDGILGWAASTLYTLIVQIANVDIFGNYIYTMMGRIYTFLAIFMLFKLSISVVNYVLNPDQLTDKSKGFGKLIQNVIIVMALIIMTPQIFNWAYKLQAAILNTNVLYTIVTGHPNDSSYDPSDLQGLTSKEIVAILTKNAEDSGDMIKYELLSTFIYNDYSEDEHTAVKSDGTLCNKETTGSYSAAYDCLMDGDTINNTSGSSSDKHYGAKKGFRNEYKILVSTLCIGFAAYVFLVTAFDVALRCVKLGALQLMAPVPIISMLDPNSGKSGMFSKWLKECKNTYLSLFTRLISVYFAVEVIRGLTEPGRFVWYGTDVAVGFGFVKVFVILGLLMFAKQLPKFIEDATGIKMDTGGLNLKKKLDSIPLAGKPIQEAGKFAGRTGMALGGMAGRYLGRGISAADTRFLGGIGHKGTQFIKDQKNNLHNWSQARRATIAAAGAGKWWDTTDASRTFSEIGSDATSTFYRTTGGLISSNTADKLDNKVKRLNEYKNFKDQLTSQADFDASDMTSIPDFVNYCNAANSPFRSASGDVQKAIADAAGVGGTKALKKVYENLQASGTASMNDISAARDAWEKSQELVINGATNNASIASIKTKAARYVSSNSDVFTGSEFDAIKNENATFGEIKKGIGSATAASIAITTSEEYEKAQARKAAMPPKK